MPNTAVLYVIIGLVLLIVLRRYYSTAVLLTGFVLLLIGAIKLIRFFTNHDKRAADVISFLIGLAAILGAIVVFARFKPVLDLGVIFLGAYILLSAVLRFSSVRRLQKDSGQGMTVPIVLTSVEAVCGIFSMSTRAFLPGAMFQAAGGALTVFGILEITVILMTASARREVKQR